MLACGRGLGSELNHALLKKSKIKPQERTVGFLFPRLTCGPSCSAPHVSITVKAPHSAFLGSFLYCTRNGSPIKRAENPRARRLSRTHARSHRKREGAWRCRRSRRRIRWSAREVQGEAMTAAAAAPGISILPASS